MVSEVVKPENEIRPIQVIALLVWIVFHIAIAVYLVTQEKFTQPVLNDQAPRFEVVPAVQPQTIEIDLSGLLDGVHE